MTEFLHAFGFGLVTASIIALASIGFSLQFTVTRTPNFAHGELLTLGAYGALVAQGLTHSLPVEVVSAVAVGAVSGSLMNIVAMQPFLRAGAKRLTIFLVTVAVGLIIQNSILLIFGGAPSSFELPAFNLHHIGPFLWTTQDLVIMVGALAILVGLHLMLRYTRLGKALRAVSDNPQLARITGIKTPRIVQVTWTLDGALSGLAGFVLAAYIGGLTPTIGFTFLVVVFAASVIGGLGRPYGTLAGALVIGLAMEISAVYIPAEYKLSVAFVILILTLLVRPSGLFSTEIWKFSE